MKNNCRVDSHASYLLALLLFFSQAATRAQGSYTLPREQIIPGRPWTNIIPDPGTFDWSTREGGRPGYRYRGMLPMQQRFYEYIQQKRRNNQPLSWAEQATIRWLITSRRWPEPPRPNAFWSAFMRYLREQPTADLNIAQGIMLDQLVSRGLVPVDAIPNRNFERVRQYLNSGPFQSRNWFERIFGRVEPWMDNLYAGFGYDMRPAAAPSGTAFPQGDPFNGLKVTYNVGGASLGETTDRGGFTISRHHQGILGSGALSISGTVRVGGYGADISLSVWAGDKKEEKKFYVENKGNDGNPQSFNLSVPIPAGARTGGFAIRLDGRYSMGGGHRGCYVTGDFGPSQAQLDAERAAADAKWRQEVENTLQRLGYENTPEGKEIEAMREALAGGDAAWQEFVDQRLEQMRGDTSTQDEEFQELQNAMNTGGDEWENYVATHGATGSSAGGNTSAASPLIKQGRDYYDAGKYREAVDAYTKALAANPSLADAYAGRGLAKRGLQDNAGAQADIDRALQLDPSNSEAHRGRSMIKRSNRDYAGAASDATRAVELDPQNYRAYLTRGLAREELKDVQGALADYARAIELNPSYANAYLYRGRARLLLNDNRGALGDLDRYIKDNQKNSSAYNNRGRAKENLGDLQGALSDYESAVRLDPQNKAAAKNLSELQAKLPDTPAPVETSEEAEILDVGNIYGVQNGPTSATRFTIPQPHMITLIITYHWNNAAGRRPGTIGLRNFSGETFGPWPAEGSPGQGDVPNAYWKVTPNVVVPAGTYTIIDSDPSTWAQNSSSQGRGFALVKGRPAEEREAEPEAEPRGGSEGATVTAIFENRSGENVHIFVAGETFGPANKLAPGEKREVQLSIPADGRITFHAGRNGQVLAKETWDGDPDQPRRYPRVIYNGDGHLFVLTGLRRRERGGEASPHFNMTSNLRTKDGAACRYCRSKMARGARCMRGQST